MTVRYRRGRKIVHHRPAQPAQVDLRLGGQPDRVIIYPRVACAVARWIDQQRTIRNKREE